MELKQNNTKDNFPHMCLGCNSVQKKILVNLEPEDNGDYYCSECLLKAYLLANPIKFDKGSIKNWIINKLIEDTEACAEEVMLNPMEIDCQKFIEFVVPFLESK